MPEALQKEVVREGNGTDKPKAGDTVSMDYTGWLYEKDQPEHRGKVYVSQKLLDQLTLTIASASTHPKTAENSKPKLE